MIGYRGTWKSETSTEVEAEIWQNDTSSFTALLLNQGRMTGTTRSQSLTGIVRTLEDQFGEGRFSGVGSDAPAGAAVG